MHKLNTKQKLFFVFRRYTQYGCVRNGGILSVLGHCLVVSEMFQKSLLFLFKIAPHLNTVPYKALPVKAFLIKQYWVYNISRYQEVAIIISSRSTNTYPALCTVGLQTIFENMSSKVWAVSSILLKYAIFVVWFIHIFLGQTNSKFLYFVKGRRLQIYNVWTLIIIKFMKMSILDFWHTFGSKSEN